MVTPRKKVSVRVRFEVFKRDNFTCRYCGRRPPDVELALDHLIPVADGGTNDDENLVCSCDACNAGKSDRPVSELTIPATVNSEMLAKLEKSVAEQRAAAELHRQSEELIEDQAFEFDDAWGKAFGLTDDGTKHFVAPPNNMTIRSMLRRGTPLPLLMDALAATRSKAYHRDTRWSWHKSEAAPYFYGCVRRMSERGTT